MKIHEDMRRKDLGVFLKTRRKNLIPEAYGFNSKNRRTTGLRREEVSLLIDVSVDWYTRLEQGRDIHVSSRVLDNIADVFHLKASERTYLFLLSQQTVPMDTSSKADTITPSLQTFLDNQGTSPSYITNLKWDIIAWNNAACVVFGDYNKMNHFYRNSIWRAFHSQYMKNILDDWSSHAKKRVAQFRASYSRLYKDPWWESMLNDLILDKDFKSWWDLYNIQESPDGDKVLHHPIAGTLHLGYLSFRWCDNPNLLITVHMPTDEESSDKIKNLINNYELQHKK